MVNVYNNHIEKYDYNTKHNNCAGPGGEEPHEIIIDSVCTCTKG